MLSPDFYPTPRNLVNRMLEGVDLQALRYILEPSAGKGDLCDVLKERTDSSYHHYVPQLDVIEIDTELQHVLRGKKYNLVHDDFLSFDTHRAYDLIIANFPFSDGDKHLQHALGLIQRNGGSLVCLVNAETIRNPHTTLRQSVLQTLTDARAQIEYIAGAFSSAERPTNVEVAMIRVSIERPTMPSLVLDELRKADATITHERPRAEIIDADPITALAARYQLEARAGVRLIDEYFSLLPYIAERRSFAHEDTKDSGIIKLTLGDRREIASRSKGANGYVEALREKYWSLLIRNDRFTTAYTSNILAELEGRLDELKQADFTLFNIRMLEEELRKRIRSGIEQAILGLFDELSRKFSSLQSGNIHYYNGWKSNAAHKINKKVVIPMNGISSYGNHLEYRIHEKLSDMVKVFEYLEQDGADAPFLVASATRQAEATGNFRMNLHYFDVTFYKKGTAHITFKNERLLDKFNLFASQRRGWLPPSYGKKPYAEMDDDERSAVDAFQGEVAYAGVLENAGYYLTAANDLLLTSADTEAS